MRIVLDTNVLVSGLLKSTGPPARLVDLVLAGAVMVLYDERIMAEYREVLIRPKFKFDADDVASVCDYIEGEGERIKAAALALVLEDRDDLPFLEVACSGKARALVTGNPRHFPKECEIPILSPKQFLAILESASKD